jgi:hypothetical protein
MTGVRKRTRGLNTLLRLMSVKTGSPTRPQDAGRQSFHSTRGSDAPPGSVGKRHTRGREAGSPPHLGRELEGREMRKPFLILSAKRWSSGKPSALKGARSVWEREVGNVRMPKVRERRVPAVFALASPFGDEATR